MRIFWDTNLFIYLWEEPARGRMEPLLAWQEAQNAEVVTSCLTLGELLVKPMQRERSDLVEQYSAAFAQLHLIEFDRNAAFRFAQLRASYPRLPAPDAVQLACAASASVDLFVTNDRRLSRLEITGTGAIRALPDALVDGSS